MNLTEFKEKLIDYASYLNQIPIGNARELHHSFINKFERLLDKNYEIYVNSSAEERIAIRQIIKDHDRDEKDVYEGGPVPAPFRYALNSYSIRAIKKLEESGSVTWLWRGLVAISILDGIHYRPDDIEHLARLYVAAEEKGIDPKPIFQSISEISNKDLTKFGESSTRELIADTPNRAQQIVSEFRKMFLFDKENE